MAKALDCSPDVNEFKLQSHDYIHFQTNTPGKGMNLLISPAMGWKIPLLLFYKDSFSIESPMKVNMPLNKPTKPNNSNTQLNYIFINKKWMNGALNWSILISDIRNQYTVTVTKKKVWYSSRDIWNTYSKWEIWKFCYYPYRSSNQVHTNQI